jgi:transcriptional regulator NrdR family protein
MKKETIIITKASGEQVPFDVKKLSRSLQRSGASDETVQQVLAEVKEQLFTGISTKQIFQLAFSLLRRASRSFAARYKLKSAIMELGPSGYPFERYVGEILASRVTQLKSAKFCRGIV